MELLLISKLIILLSILVSVQTIKTRDRNDKKYKVICFWGSWSYYRTGDGSFTPENIDPNICTHLIYGFAKMNQNHEISPFDPYLDIIDHHGEGIGCYKKFNSIRDRNPKLTTMIAMGDMTDQRNRYLEMITTERTRKTFIESVKKFLNEYDFDGLELTWEYPGVYYYNLTTEYNTKNLILLLKELHQEFLFSGHLLSISLSVSESNIMNNSYDISIIGKYVNFVNLLTFEFHTPSKKEQYTGPNAPLHSNQNDSEHDQKFTIHYAVDHWLNSTKDSKKLVLGIPAFGHSFKLLSPTRHSWKSPIIGSGINGRFTKTPGTLGYNEICELQQKELNKWQVFNDSSYQVPYMWKDYQFISFDDPKSTEYKLNFLKNKQLGGAMIWTIDTDDFRGKCGFGYFPITSTVMKNLNEN